MKSPDLHDTEKLIQWRLPARYNDMSSNEQQQALRSAILAFLSQNGPAAKSVIEEEIGAPKGRTVQRALDYLATTQQVYLDSISGSRDPTYAPNGRLAHPLGQREVEMLRFKYVIRAYHDRLAGKTVAITQYAVQPSGEMKPVAGIRVDSMQLKFLAEELMDLAKILMEAEGNPPDVSATEGTFRNWR